MPKHTIIAKDCMPFYNNGKERHDCLIGEDRKAKGFETLALFAESVVPLSLFGNEKKDDDIGNQLAYSPFENKPIAFKTDQGVVYQRVWQAGRFVGTTQIKDTTIEILPRFGIEWLNYILADVFHFKLVRSGSDERQKGEFNNLIRRILWHLWVRAFASADQYGLPKRVIKHTYSGMQIRGHVNIRQSLSPLYKKGHVVSEYREKDIDDAICKIVYKAYCILVNRQFNKTSAIPQIQDSLNALFRYYQGETVSVSLNDYKNLGYKSIYLSWKPLVDFSWQIIQQDTLFRQKGSKGDSFSVFLDMAEIWEAFLRNKLGDAFSKSGWRVLSIEECTCMIYPGQFFKRQIIPDIILEKDGNYMVFDAKYKLMRGLKSSVNYSDLDRTDLFQIHSYIQYVQHCLGNVVVGGLLYPISAQDIDTESWHSNNLFGLEGSNHIPFIVDGIICTDIIGHFDKKQLEIEVGNMIDRIRETIGETQ